MRIGLALICGLVFASCGPEVFDMKHCATVALYDAPDSFPECAFTSYCGDGLCDRSQESHASCAGDCPPPQCGDGVCDEGEDLTCPDCEYIPPYE